MTESSRKALSSSESSYRKLFQQLTPTSCCYVHNRKLSEEGDIVSMKSVILWALVGSPIPAFIYCLVKAYTSGSYDKTTITHCGVANFAMSVSEATSVPKSSRRVWLFGVLLHTYPRIVHANEIYKYFESSLMERSSSRQQWWISWMYIDW